MKTKLLFASALALLMASCSQDEQFVQAPSADGDGISFVGTLEGDAVDTKAYLTPGTTAGTYDVNWIADGDLIAVMYKNGTKVGPAARTGTAISGNWYGKSTTEPYEFRASASGMTGYFVANDVSADKLVLTGKPSKASEKPVFRAYWPADLTMTSGKVTIPDLERQEQTTANGEGIIDKYSFMYSETVGEGEYDAVGTNNSVSKNRFKLGFTRINPVVYFTVKASADANGLNREYKRDYADKLISNLGGLSSVELKSEGSTKEGSTLAKTKMTYGSSATFDMGADDLSKVTVAAASDAATEVTTKFTTPCKNSEITAFMVIANMDRSAYSKAKETEKMTTTYGFKEANFTKSVETNNSWTGNRWYGLGINLDEEPYIAYPVKVGSSTTYVLEVNASYNKKLSEVFDNNGNVKDITKSDGTTINKTDITQFVSKINITTAEDWNTIKGLGNGAVTHITLLENVDVPSKAFNGLSQLTYLNLPKVTEVKNVDAFPANAYTEVYMGSYDFSDNAQNATFQAVRERLLLKSSLVKADVAGVANINAGFPTSGVSFANFTKLKEVTVADGAVIGGTAFQNCTSLVNVQFPQGISNGKVDLYEGANSQFEGCKELPAISFKNTVIPDQAFMGCAKLVSLATSKNEEQRPTTTDYTKTYSNVVPTSIGISAFEGCEALTDIDLSKAATIGEAAFKDCKALGGNYKKKPGRMVLYVEAAEKISDNAFENCAKLEYISFSVATSIGVKILAGCELKEIEFLKPFTVSSYTTSATNLFGTTDGTKQPNCYQTKLFVAKDQSGVKVNTITLTGTVAKSSATSADFAGGITKYNQ